MFTQRSKGFLTSIIPAFRGCAVLVLIAGLAYHLQLNSAATGFVFLMAIVLNCLDCRIRSAMIVSIFAVGLLNYFFIEPLLTFRIAHADDVAALAAFLTASLVTTRLASKAREQAHAARLDRYNLQLLYECAQQLLVLDPLHTEPAKFLETIMQVFKLKAVCYFDVVNATFLSVGDSRCLLEAKTRDSYIAAKDSDDRKNGVALRQLRSGGKTTGVLGFEGLDQPHLLAGPAAALVSTVLERAEACQTATRAEDATRAETLRTAILDALAHEFKTPLATILTAAGGIRAAGPLLDQQDELAEMIETEAERLGHLSSRLVRLARIGSGEVRLQCERFDIDTEVREVIERFPAESRRRIFFVNQGTRRELSADVELFQLATSQLLDNACKYSPSESTVEVSTGDNQRFLWVQVTNCGTPILPSERNLIFERFFRGEGGQKLAGTGLGLYVARKIALAHGGSLDLIPAQPVRQEVTFRLAFPLRGDQYGIAA